MKDREKQRINDRNYYARKKGFKDHAHMLAHKAKQEDHCAPFSAYQTTCQPTAMATLRLHIPRKRGL